jgi:hypothetical protein
MGTYQVLHTHDPHNRHAVRATKVCVHVPRKAVQVSAIFTEVYVQIRVASSPAYRHFSVNIYDSPDFRGTALEQ